MDEPLIGDNQQDENEKSVVEARRLDKNLFEEPAEFESQSSPKVILIKLIGDAANNRAKLMKAIEEKCEDPESEDYKKVLKKFQKLMMDCIGEPDNYNPELNGQLTDYLAQLIYLAPLVSGIIFDLLLKPVDQQDLKHVKIKGTFMNDPMLAVYTDLDLASEENRNRAHVHCKDFRKSTIPPNYYEVTQEEFVLPNVMDLDIIQALAYTDRVEIFAKKSVQAMLYCAWRPIMVPAVRIQTILALVDLACLFAWGMTTAGGKVFDRFWWTTTHDSTDEQWLVEHNYSADAWKAGNAMEHVYAYDSPRHVPSCWNVLAASALRQALDIVWMTKSFFERKHDADKPGAQQALRLFWGWDAYFLMIFNTKPLLLIFKCTFLVLTTGRKERVMTSAEQAMLCATFFFTITALVAPFRVVASKISLSLMAIKKAVIDEDVVHFVIFISIMFIFFILSFEIIDREQTITFGLVQGFRGLIVGDGDGLDFLGLKTDDETVKDEEAHKFRAAFGTLGMILFFTYLMQLLIAIFSNTYDNAVKFVWLHFHQARAQDLRDAILGHHKFRQNSQFMKGPWNWLFCKPYIFWIGVVIFVTGICMQVGVHVIPPDIWTKDIYILGTIVGILALTLGAVMLESSAFMWDSPEDDWFPATRDTLTKKHRLTVFCRADYDESYFTGDDHMEKRVVKIEESLGELAKKFDTIEKTLRENLG